MILKWIKRKLLGWLREEEDCILECLILKKDEGKEPTTFRVVGSTDMMLRGESIGLRHGIIRLINENDAIDREKFWRIWHKFSPSIDLRWEDGSKYSPVA